jgi:hypothetical protein
MRQVISIARACSVAAVLFIIVLGSAHGHAADLRPGNDAYQRGDYEAAIEHYESLLAEGLVHEDLYYNLANANYRAGRYGHAIFNYERALRIAPEQADLLYNLAVVHEAVAADGQNRLEGAEKDAWWVRIALDFPISTTTLALLLCNLLFFVGLLMLRFLVPGLVRTAVVVFCVFLGATGATSGLLLFGHTYANEKIHNGVVTADLTIMREGPGASLEERGQLHPGLRVQVLGRDPDWLLIRLANGVEGWVPRTSIGLFD